ncbi:MAG: hypothetical protein MK085_02860 [Phycisphaerales bacterium]|nr:hypothetical protein [Phycisphaerales bacterium]
MMKFLFLVIPAIIRGLRENPTGVLTVIGVIFGVFFAIGLTRHLLGCEDESGTTEETP